MDCGEFLKFFFTFRQSDEMSFFWLEVSGLGLWGC
ncbi:hypothetical protein FX983_06038 [Pseudomonas frederiksbergensis]|uniref:Uncharacterized protein n=1 Tax=Pseudomonas frederiksbergensis TaxID=104087 RepID=A0A6L5BT65_9PSED|nr:hypothetical protein FX983_06038 [Pseudomonas frederiksbergensis]